MSFGLCGPGRQCPDPMCRSRFCRDGLHVSGVYPGNPTFLLIEAPRSTWASLEGLTSFTHVFDISGPNAISQIQAIAGQSENVGLKERPASSQNKPDNSNMERETKFNATSRNARSENTIS